MMKYVHFTTLQAVAGLSIEELNAIPPGFSNSIGMLLAHIAALDRLYQRLSFRDRGFDDQEWQEYSGPISLGEGERVRGLPLKHYLNELTAARADTLARHDDAWLASNLRVPGFESPNHHWA
ncbi:DinB family protein [Deinococcus apachensis]|uniref:DinB family protein n=1 Tax=Deinococcus apachensis TaxID=309886 RepID=UPI00036543DE|nr:DinB family protein [Deinococcus apachensis]